MKQVIDKINEADFVLIGLGEEVDLLPKLQHNSEYQKKLELIKNSWMVPYIEKIEIDRRVEEKKEFYHLIAHCLTGKNYFIVSICQDGGMKKAGLDEERIVEPCGGYGKMQCSERCSTELYDVPLNILQSIERYWKEVNVGEKEVQEELGLLESIREPVCPHCGKPLVFNNVNALKYVEEGYLTQWSIYKKWLQGTMNKKVCLIEMGVGMKYPTVIRWPFEKIAFYNQKAELFRVHSRLYQITEEIQGKGHGICQKPEEFMKELSNAF
ncbi:hypothetical protein [Parablautia muri]|uniref:NAD-dependent protein deacetylase, SIR2 family n=1 Tax=Parablautia muri TaxID=2320879 RepID=A0A9X5GQ48_9FIRM|nr:hypothetical protein [Parablautia muri]NBJ91613.1 hypothetical protein [Parablautia muri]